jgi:cell division protein FtsB
LRTKITKLEEEIAKLEAEIKTFDDQLADPAKYQQLVNDKAAFADYEAKRKRLDAAMSEWEAAEQEAEKG